MEDKILISHLFIWSTSRMINAVGTEPSSDCFPFIFFTSLTVNIIDMIKVDFIGEQLYWIALDCAGVPNEQKLMCLRV